MPLVHSNLKAGRGNPKLDILIEKRKKEKSFTTRSLERHKKERKQKQNKTKLK
jgi:hypothetical protein